MILNCFGDSNTYGYDPRSFFGEQLPEEERWVTILSELMNCTVINNGENGREIPRKSWELEAFERLRNREPKTDIWVIMLGTNDLLQGNSVIEVSNRMEWFLQQIHIDLKKVLLIGPPLLQPGEWVPTEELVISSRELNKAYKDLSTRMNMRFVDAGEWELPVAFDGVHLTCEGHRIFAKELFCFLKEGE